MLFNSLLTVLSSAVGAFSAAGQLVQVTNFGDKPTGVGMFVYKPAQPANPSPLIIAMHYCSGTAQAYFTGTQHANLADTHGFIVIYPNAPTAGGCWDVHTNATLTHNAGGDSLGNCLTNVFAPGSAFSGVPYGCFEGPDTWNTQCALGELIMTPQQAMSFAVDRYAGVRPKFQCWHGTADTTLYPQNFWEDIKQWTNVIGAILAQCVGHTVPEQANDVLTWFSLSDLTPGGGAPSSGPTTAPTGVPTSPPSPPAGGTVWGQCGGLDYTGPTVCVTGFSCVAANAYHSQCL
ncbi:hypothetical protein EUX98_g3244 [Antrodiella citrinella]|uniref:CBM1 domain-containing protein n=1 Tax=Antrodiella citrinella TaxID=2447956 RepID=A0A4V3XIY5_9APHY|nr:hypothetical protein EUX98_g3244 [Antrodiella citrinella]